MTLMCSSFLLRHAKVLSNKKSFPVFQLKFCISLVVYICYKLCDNSQNSYRKCQLKKYTNEKDRCFRIHFVTADTFVRY